MRNILKASTLESKFPLLAVEHGCILSKEADITVAFEVELPELYTVTSAEYEAIHSAWCKAIKVLPDYSIVHKQDWFVREQYRHCKPILVLGAGADLLARAMVPSTLPDGAADPGLLVDAPLAAFMEALAGHRAFARETDPPLV